MNFFQRSLIFISIICSVSAELSPFTLMTIPKSGSHLAMKALKMLTNADPIWHTHFPSFFCIDVKHGYLYTHLCLSEQLEQNYKDLPQLKKLVMIRDLRDVCVSVVHQIRKNPWPGLSGPERKAFLKLSFDEQLLFVINHEYDIYEVMEQAPNSIQASMIRIAEQAIRYSSDRSNLTIRYEDLVGPLGGGTLRAQLESLESIARHIGIDNPSLSLLLQIADSLYGDEHDPFGKGSLKNFKSTFNRGKIGSWKEFFTQEHVEAFKRKLGPHLIALGYELDDRW